MTTKLTKPISREVLADTPYGVSDQLIVSLVPPAFLVIREKGRRKFKLKIDLGTLYVRSLALKAEADREERRLRRRLARNGG